MRTITLVLVAMLALCVWAGSEWAWHRNDAEHSRVVLAVRDVRAAAANLRDDEGTTLRDVFPAHRVTGSLGRRVLRSTDRSRSGDTGADPWGGIESVAPVGGWGGALVDLTVTGVPASACPQLAAAIRGASINSVTIDGTDLVVPVTAVEARSACSRAENRIVWRIER